MLLGIGSSEIIIGVPVLIAAIIAGCTPTSIAMASWVSLHGLIGLLLGIGFYFLYRPNAEVKRRIRIVYFGLIIFGVGLGIAAAIHGGVGRKNGTYQDKFGVKRWFYQYDFDLFFGVYIAFFETCLMLWGIWSIFADRRKAEMLRTLANSRGSSFASLAAYRQTLDQEALKHSHSGFFAKKKESKVDLTLPALPALPEASGNSAVTPNKKNASKHAVIIMPLSGPK